MTGRPVIGRLARVFRHAVADRPLRDRRGSVAVLVALGATGLMGATALGIDLGLLYQASRKAQSAADIAAMVAAANIGSASSAAQRSLTDNGYGTAPMKIEPGRYVADSRVAPAARFQAAGTPANAVRVSFSTTAHAHFARVLGLPADVGIRASGLAARAQFASFTVGSGLVALDGGVANAILGSLLGTKLSLRVMDYNALLSARIDAFRFLDALSTKLGLQAASYNDVLTANASIGQILSALQIALNGQLAASAAVGAVISSLPGTTPMVPVGKLVGLGDAAALSPGRGSAGPSITAMDLLSAAATVANGQTQVSVDLGANVPGLLSTRLTIAIGERAQSSGWVQPGTANATVRTAQTRVLLETSLTAPLGLGLVNLPIYIEAASAQATLRSVSCPWSDPSQRAVGIDAQTGLLTLAIANVDRTTIRSTGATPDLTRPADIVQVLVPLLAVRAGARVSMDGSYARTLSFSDADITAHTVKSVSATGLTGSAIRSLLGNLTLDINGVAPPPLLATALGTTLGTIATPLDGVLDTTLRVLGIRLGIADVSVDGTRCDQAVLVQ